MSAENVLAKIAHLSATRGPGVESEAQCRVWRAGQPLTQFYSFSFEDSTKYYLKPKISQSKLALHRYTAIQNEVNNQFVTRVWMTSLLINHIFATMTCYQHFVSIRKYTIGYFVRRLNDQFLFSEFRHHILKWFWEQKASLRTSLTSSWRGWSLSPWTTSSSGRAMSTLRPSGQWHCINNLDLFGKIINDFWFIL